MLVPMLVLKKYWRNNYFVSFHPANDSSRIVVPVFSGFVLVFADA
jgi:hypothetical protein